MTLPHFWSASLGYIISRFIFRKFFGRSFHYVALQKTMIFALSPLEKRVFSIFQVRYFDIKVMFVPLRSPSANLPLQVKKCGNIGDKILIRLISFMSLVPNVNSTPFI